MNTHATNRFTSLFSAALALLMAFASPVQGQTVFESTLSSSNETRTVISPANGSMTAVLTGTSLAVSGTFDDLSADFDATVSGGAHIHSGMAGQDGAILFSLTPVLDADMRGGTFLEATNTFTLTAEQISSLQARGLYFNIHTTAHASGELRGQLRPEADATYRATLSGGAETKSNTSAGAGMVIAEQTGNTLIVSGAFANLEASLDASVQGGAHIHMGNAGTDGAIQFNLTSTTEADGKAGVFLAADNTFTLSTAQMDALEDHGLYVNVHSQDYAGGELRGQFISEGSVGLKAVLAGSNEQPAVSSSAHGQIVAELDGSSLRLSGAFADLASDFDATVMGGAHIHSGMAGQNGSIDFALNAVVDAGLRSGKLNPTNNTFNLDATAMTALQARGLYVNIHTVDHQSGELRGQLAGSAGAVFTAVLGGDQESPSIESGGSGTVLIELNGGNAIVTGSFANLSSDFDASVQGGAHLHNAYGGSNGAIEVGLTAEAAGDLRSGAFLASDNTFALTAEQAAELKARAMYVNVHTEEDAAGEIRGQALPSASTHFHAALNGSASSGSSGSGDIFAEITSNGDLVVTGGYSDLEADINASGGAHLMIGDVGTDGQTSFELTSDASGRAGNFVAADNTFTLDAATRAMLEAGHTFVEIRTGGSADEELRGQIGSVSDVNFEADLQARVTSGSSGTVTAYLKGDSLIVSGTFADLVADFDASTGARLFSGTPQESGNAELTLTTQADADLRGGAFLASENRFELTASQKADLMSGQMFVHVETTADEDASLRGQVLVSANADPTAAVLTLPDPNSAISLEGTLTGSTTFQWDASHDPNGNDVFYTWQLSEDATFDTVVMTRQTGTDTSFDMELQAMADKLSDLGHGAGSGEVTLYHRVMGSDGSAATASGSEMVLFNLGTGTASEDLSELPKEFRLTGVYPNPFNPATTIQFDLPEQSDVRVDVLNLLGQRVDVISRDAMPAGSNRSVHFEAGSLPSGLYLYRVTISSPGLQQVRTGTMTLIK